MRTYREPYFVKREAKYFWIVCRQEADRVVELDSYRLESEAKAALTIFMAMDKRARRRVRR